MFLFAQVASSQLPPLPEGPALDRVRAPIEGNAGFEPWQLALAALAVALLAAGLIWLYLRSRQKPAAPVDPHAAALAELEAAPQAADDERFAMLCANALRRFIEARFQLPATSRTSREISECLPIPSEDGEQLRAFLDHCDGVKFAGRSFNTEQRHELLDTAKRLLETLERKESAAAS